MKIGLPHTKFLYFSVPSLTSSIDISLDFSSLRRFFQSRLINTALFSVFRLGLLNSALFHWVFERSRSTALIALFPFPQFLPRFSLFFPLLSYFPSPAAPHPSFSYKRPNSRAQSRATCRTCRAKGCNA